MTKVEKIFQEWVDSKDNPKMAQKALNRSDKVRGLIAIDICLAYMTANVLGEEAYERYKSRLFDELDKFYEEELIIQLAGLK